ncbi:MAG: ABC transporter permease, partial [Acidimicrobiia bacterium]
MTDTAVAPPRPQTIWGRVGGFLVARPESTIAIVALALATYFAVVNPAFLTTANIRVISQYMIATAILAA